MSPFKPLTLLLLALSSAAYASKPSVSRCIKVQPSPLLQRRECSCTDAVMSSEEREALQMGALLGPLQFARDIQGVFPNNEWPPPVDEIVHNTHVAPSSRHGLGLFASVDIPRNTVATFYPVDAIGLSGVGYLGEEGKFDMEDMYELELQHQSTVPGTLINVAMDHTDVKGWLAHRVNDATTCIDNSKASILQYYGALLENNCAAVPFGEAVPIVALVTIRDVQKGEELLTSYGPMYWLQDNSDTPLKPEVKDTVGQIVRMGQVLNNSLAQVIDIHDSAVDGCRKALQTGSYKEVIAALEALLSNEYKWPPSDSRKEGGPGAPSSKGFSKTGRSKKGSRSGRNAKKGKKR